MNTRLLAFFLTIPSVAHAGFAIEGMPIQSTQQGDLSLHAPYQDRGRAPFRPQVRSSGAPEGKSDSVLFVDLAYTALTESGSGNAEIIDGFGDQIPLADFFSFVVPRGWQVFKHQSIKDGDLPSSVSFDGAKPWTEHIKGVGESEGLKFHVDWNVQTVEIQKGRMAAAKRIHVIPEPPAPKPVTPIAPVNKPVVADTTTPAPSTSPATGTSTQTTSTTAAAKPTAPVVAAAPRLVRLSVQKGLLSENLIRLSKEFGWNDPEWKLDTADFAIRNNYTIEGKDFTEAVSKLLMLHPIEAEVNTATKKITVIKEAR